jgi:rubredoxin
MLHKHKCENAQCGLVFEHERPDTRGMEATQAEKFYADGHMCPQCHTGPYLDRYFENPAEWEKFRKQRLIELFDSLNELFRDGDNSDDEPQVKVFEF